MFEFNGKVLATENVAISELIKAVTEIQQSLGNALPDPIEGPQGPKGDTGDTGPEGPQGNSIIGYGTQLPGIGVGRNGDWYFLDVTDEIGHNVVMYRKVNYKWLPQFSTRGPLGPTGPEGGTSVVPNDEQSELNNILNTINIDGTNYLVNTNNYLNMVDSENTYFQAEMWPYITYIYTLPLTVLDISDLRSEDPNYNESWVFHFKAGSGMTNVTYSGDQTVNFPYGSSVETGTEYTLFIVRGIEEDTFNAYIIE